MAPTLGKNPFRPGVGTRPLHLAGRDGSLRRFRAMLRAAPEQPANMRLTGLRGVGKTVLLGEFGAVAADEDWVAAAVELQPGHNMEEALIGAVTALAKSEREKLSRLERLLSAVGGTARKAGKLSVTWEEVTFSYSLGGGEPDEDLGRSLFETVEMAAEKGRHGFVLLLDEAQVVRDERDRGGEHPMSLLISTVVALQRREVPLGLVVCGLPTLTGNLLRARSYTERMFRGEQIGSLDEVEAREALLKPLQESAVDVTAAPDLVAEVVDEVEGYPYFIQLWGAELWDAADDVGVTGLSAQLLEAVRPDIYRRLDSDFYEPRVATLTPAEQDVLLATAQCPYPPIVVADLNDVSDKTPGNVNVLLGRLVESGVLYRVRKGQYEYTAPKFRDYLLRRTSPPS